MSFEQILAEHTEVHNTLRSSFGNISCVHFFTTQFEYGLRVGPLKVTFDKNVSPHSKSVLVQNAGKKDTKTDFKKVMQLIKKQVDKSKAEQSAIEEYEVIEKMEALDVSASSTASQDCRPEYNKNELKRLAEKHSLLFIRIPKEKRLNVITGGAFLSTVNELTDSMSKLNV
jgi:hypothetical protein